jgi:hypothetical protein
METGVSFSVVIVVSPAAATAAIAGAGAIGAAETAIATAAVAAASTAFTTAIATAAIAASVATAIAAATATVAATITTAITATTAATKAARARGTGLHGARFVHHEAAPAQWLSIHALNGCLRLGIAAHFDKPESLGAACVAFHHDPGAGDSAELAECLLQVVVTHTIGKVADVKLIAHQKLLNSSMLTGLRSASGRTDIRFFVYKSLSNLPKHIAFERVCPKPNYEAQKSKR